MNELSLFAGAGGGILGGKLLGWNTVGAVEIEKYPKKVLLQRQKDGILSHFPIWDDITTFDGRPWKGCIDIVSGGFPCQDISAAGKGAGIDGERSGLWGEMARVIDEVRPQFAFMENSPMLTSRGLGRVLGDLAEMGYNARWCVLGADDAGAPHRRKRIWILGYTSMYGQPAAEIGKGINEGSNRGKTRKIAPSQFKGSGSTGINEDVADSNMCYVQGNEPRKPIPEEWEEQRERSFGSCGGIRWWDTDPADVPDTGGNSSDSSRIRSAKPSMGRVANGIPRRVDRLKAIGNAQVPAVAAIAFTILSEGLI